MAISLGEVLLQLGRLDEAEQQARETLLLARSLGDRRGEFWGLVLLAWAAAVRGDVARAGRLWGAAEVEEEERPSGQWVYERDLYTERVFVTHSPEFSRAREIGRRLGLERAVEEELAD